MLELTKAQKERYNRHIILPDFGIEGQTRLLKARILIIGTGGLGSPVSLYLSAAGVGTLGIADNDVVDVSNLQRQIIHSTDDVKKSKLDSAARKMKAINPDLNIEKYQKFIKADNIMDIIKRYDFVLDCTDNFSSKFLINDACVLANIPYSHGGVMHFHGQTMTVVPGSSSCYRCLFSEPPPVKSNPPASDKGILGVIPGILGTIQATEAIKCVTTTGKLLTDTLLTFDAKTMDFLKIKLKRQKNCPLCGEHPSITKLTDSK
ncbi:HesA/MoeB/ThiF family protein [bacterium]|nr:HesA/MoeB/ThiF family protein [bacterium]